jgi:hypothetical protein
MTVGCTEPDVELDSSRSATELFRSLFCLFLGADEKNRRTPSDLAVVTALRNCCHQPLARLFQL